MGYPRIGYGLLVLLLVSKYIPFQQQIEVLDRFSVLLSWISAAVLLMSSDVIDY
jgi:hypothetical protein